LFIRFVTSFGEALGRHDGEIEICLWKISCISEQVYLG